MDLQAASPTNMTVSDDHSTVRHFRTLPGTTAGREMKFKVGAVSKRRGTASWFTVRGI
jgi:hypothetical protein